MRKQRLWSAIVALMTWLVSLPAVPEEMDAHTVLTPAGLAELNLLGEYVRHGELGDEATEARISTPIEGVARIEVVRRHGDSAGFTLLPPFRQDKAASRRHFELVPDDGIAASHTDRLTAILEKVLANDPWSYAAKPRPAFWMLPGGDFRAVTSARMLFAFFFLVGSIAAGLAFILYARPRSDGERLVAK